MEALSNTKESFNGQTVLRQGIEHGTSIIQVRKQRERLFRRYSCLTTALLKHTAGTVLLIARQWKLVPDCAARSTDYVL
jgi:hypothetical protein